MMRVKDVLPAVTLGKNQRVHIYSAPEGKKLCTLSREAVMKDPRTAAGENIWIYEVVQIDACSSEAFNIIVALPHEGSKA